MGKKIGILMENRFIDQEIIYYENYFREEGFAVEFLTRLWGQPQLTFTGLELDMEKTVNKSFQNITEKDVNNFEAFILPAGYVADYLLYAENPGELSPAVEFIKMIMENKSIIKGFICHSLWIAGPIPEVFKNRKVSCHNNIIGHVKNTGAEYRDQDIVVDEDLVTARDGGIFAAFAKKIVAEIKKQDNISKVIYRDKIEEQDIGGGIMMQNLGKGERMNVLHWDMEDGSVVDWHEHPQEQFGYVITGGFKIFMGDEEYTLKSGDAYFVPPDTSHKFIAQGETEAIDVFNPVREDIPGKNN